jgi:uncharacterized protein YbjT (DUF2867 family)
MTQHYKTACVFGGTGFVGRQIVRALADLGYLIKVATRIPERAYFLKTAGTVGQIVPHACRYSDPQSVQEAVKGCDVVVNCIGILFEKGKNTFQAMHVDVPRLIAQSCTKEGVSTLIHLSALGCDTTQSKYGKSKKQGEDAILAAFPKASILRPSIVFGQEDSFFNRFAQLSMILPCLPLIGGGHTKFQPVYVGDVAKAVMAIIENPSFAGKIYELGGPEIFTFKEIYTMLFEQIGRKRILLPLPWGVAKIQGHIFSVMPTPLLTADQVESLKTDNIVSAKAFTLQDLGIVPMGVEAILPSYLMRYRPGGRFGDKKRA